VSYALYPSTNYTIFTSGIIATGTVVTGLISGETYTFVVKSRNIVGYSDYS
jgi:hypothetical protein